MQWWQKYLIVLGTVSFLPNSDAKFQKNIGICDPEKISCKCGKSNDDVQIFVKQCSYHTNRLRLECMPCDDDDETTLCLPFANCLTCDSQGRLCLSCPEGRFGNLCEGACNCTNGGKCNMDGSCVCPIGYYGPQCQLIAGCPALQPPRFGDLVVDSDIIGVGTSAVFSCGDGFVLEGSSILYCLKTQQWSSSAPQCLKICPMPRAPHNGFVQTSFSILRSGSTVIFTCGLGFVLQGHITSKCLPDGTWSRETPRCEKVSYCDEPSYSGNTEREMIPGILGNLSQGTKIHFKCKEGTEMLGNNTIVCKANGKWTTLAPICITGKLCQDPGEAENGIRIINNVYEDYFPPGSSIEYCCNPLYYLLGNSVITCGEDGFWSSAMPECLKFTTCQHLEERLNVQMEITPPRMLSKPIPITRVSNMSVIGSRGFSRKRFNITRLRIDSLSQNVSSPSSPSRHKRHISPLPSGHYHVGTQAKYTCISRYYELFGSHVRTCQKDGKWSGTPPTCIPVCGKYNTPIIGTIVGGNRSSSGQWPWQVGVAIFLQISGRDHRWFINCGGSVINERWVLTAAHCVTYDKTETVMRTEELRLFFGKHHRRSEMDDDMVQERNVSAIYIHPDYRRRSLNADIALIQTMEPIVFTSRVQAICLPEFQPYRSDERLKEGNRGIVIGWGRTEKGGYSSVLRYVELPVVSNHRCEQEYRSQNLSMTLTPTTFCAGYDAGKQDSCTGDSGGPFVFPLDSRQDRWVQEGIVSWGSKEGCGNAKQFSGFTRVQKFMDWIRHFI